MTLPNSTQTPEQETPLAAAQRRVTALFASLGVSRDTSTRPRGIERRPNEQMSSPALETLHLIAHQTPSERILQLGVNAVVQSVGSDRNSELAANHAKLVFVCTHAVGNTACYRTLSITDDGEQIRKGRDVTVDAFTERHRALGAEVVHTACDEHGGLEFPTTETIRARMGLVAEVVENLQEPTA